MDLLAAALDGSGPAILPVDPGLPRARVAALLNALAPATIETTQGTERMPPSRSPTPGDGPALRSATAGLLPGTAAVIATSGSPGEPKGVELSAAALLYSARASLERIGAPPGDAWLSCPPPSHIAGPPVVVRALAARDAAGCPRPPGRGHRRRGWLPVRLGGPDPVAADRRRAGRPGGPVGFPAHPARRCGGAARAAGVGAVGGRERDHHLRHDGDLRGLCL